MEVCTARSRHPDSIGQAFLWALLSTLLLVINAPDTTYAQEVVTNITPSALPACPGPCGAGVTIVTPLPPAQGGTITITGGARPGNGPNLFHSFGQFDVGAGDVANFQNTPVNGAFPATSNILSRVTGGNPSQIYGTIQTTDFSGANLFLMNPAGVLFGATAVLDLGAVTGSAVREPGSFYSSTADYLNLGDENGTSPFYADPAQTSVLSVAPIVAFGFLGPNAASIAIQGGNLEVPDGQTLSFIGGPSVFTPDTGVTVPSGVTMTAGRLSAPNGLIYMETVTAPGEIPLPTLSGSPLGSPVSFPGSENAVIYVQSGELVMKGASLLTATTGPTSGEPIDIDIEVAGQFTMQNGSTLSSSTTGEGQAGAINVSALTLALDASSITTETSGDGSAGNITANVGTLTLDNSAAINSNNNINATFGLGQGGNVTVQGLLPGEGSAADLVALTNSSTINTVTSGTGNGGEAQLTARTLTMENGSQILTATVDGSGVGGDVVLNVETVSLTGGSLIFSVSQSPTPGLGHGGNVTIQGLPGAEFGAATSVSLSVGSSLLSLNVGSGNGGDVAITAKSLTMDGAATTVSASTTGVGLGGDIVVGVQHASLSDGATIITQTISADPTAPAAATVTVQGLGNPGNKADSVALSGFGSGIVSDTTGTGRAGAVAVYAKTVNLTDRAVIQTGTSSATGAGGNVTIDADSVDISGGSGILSTSANEESGQVAITANTLILDNVSIDTKTTGDGRGGDVVLNVETVSLSNGATLNSSASGTGRAGDITMNVKSLALANHSEITNSSIGTVADAGDAGNITIQSGSTVVMSNSLMTTEAKQASGGQIEINAPEMVRLINSQVSTSVSDGTGGGGNITIDPQFVILQNSQIIAKAFAGAGGAINVIADVFLADPNSVVNASLATRTPRDS